MNLSMPHPLTRREFMSSSTAAFASGLMKQQPSGSRLMVFSDAASLDHRPPTGHPESPRRFEAVMAVVRSLADTRQLSHGATRAATDDDLRLVHSAPYVEKVRQEIGDGRRTLSTGDTDLSTGSLVAARAAAGAVVSAVDAAINGRSRAFCAVRPPGHHASAQRGMGFCIFNNVAIGARHAQRRHGIERVLIADWDVHHGNGTQEVFVSDGSVLFFDTHQHPWYPGTGLRNETGTGRGSGLIFNRPFPAGTGRAQILRAFREELVPAAARFKPQLVLVSAGFDSRANDPLGQFTLTDEDFADLTSIMIEIAGEHAEGRLVSVLEGGYSLDGLSRATRAHLERLAV